MNCFLRAPFAAIGAFVDALHPVDMTRAERMLVEKESYEDSAEPEEPSSSEERLCHWIRAMLRNDRSDADIVRGLRRILPLIPPSSAVSATDADSSAGVSVKQSAPPVEHAAAIPPAAADLAGGSPLSPPARSLTFVAGVVPAICDVLAIHTPEHQNENGIGCPECREYFIDWQEWREHVAQHIAERLVFPQHTRALPPVGPAERRCVCTEPIRWHDPMSTWVHTGRNPSCGKRKPELGGIPKVKCPDCNREIGYHPERDGNGKLLPGPICPYTGVRHTATDKPSR